MVVVYRWTAEEIEQLEDELCTVLTEVAQKLEDIRFLLGRKPQSASEQIPEGSG